jgi:hypothetical protein
MKPPPSFALICALAMACVAMATSATGATGGGHAGSGASSAGASHASSAGRASPLAHFKVSQRGTLFAHSQEQHRCVTDANPTCPGGKLQQLHALRTEALRVQRADGGALTPEHRAALQSKLDAVQQESK